MPAVHLAEHLGELREVGRGQRVAVAEHRGAEQHRLELADVARPVERAEQLQRAVGYAERPQAGCSPMRARKWRVSAGDVAAPLAQRREDDLGPGEQLEQLGAEMAGGDEVGERQVAGRDHPHVDAEAVLHPDRAHRAVAQRLEQAVLQLERQAVELVEHQRAAVAVLHRPGLAVEGAGEGALLVPEQQRFEAARGHSADVDRAERGLGARRCGLHRADQHLLAGAALALDQHRAVAARGLGRLGQRVAERRGGADHRIEIERAPTSSRSAGVSSSRGASRWVVLRSACIIRSGETGLTR